MIAGSIFENTIVVSCLAAWGAVLKGWNDFKFPIKVGRCQFAYATHAKILTKLRTYARCIPFDEDSFLVKMQTFDDTITNFSPAISDQCMQEVSLSFLLREPGRSVFCLRMFSSTYVECVTQSLEGVCSAIVCPMTMFVTLLLS